MNRPDLTVVDEAVHFSVQGRIPVNQADLEEFFRTLGRRDDLVAVAECIGERFFAENVFARREGVEGYLFVRVVGGGNEDGVYLVYFEQLTVVIEDLHVMRKKVGACGRLVRIKVAEGLYPDTVGDNVVQKEQVCHSHAAGTPDNTVFQLAQSKPSFAYNIFFSTTAE